jgi:hypothetical protein
VEPFTDLLRRLGLSLADMTAFLTRVRQSPIWSGRLIDGLLPTGEQSIDISHGLARPQRGAFIVGQDLAEPLYVLDTPHPTLLTVFAAAPVVASVRLRLWVF